MMGEWVWPGECGSKEPPTNNCILAHVVTRLQAIVESPKLATPASFVLGFTLKACVLGKPFAGKTTCLARINQSMSSSLPQTFRPFPYCVQCMYRFLFLFLAHSIHVLSVSILVQEALEAFRTGEVVLGTVLEEVEVSMLSREPCAGPSLWDAQSLRHFLFSISASREQSLLQWRLWGGGEWSWERAGCVWVYRFRYCACDSILTCYFLRLMALLDIDCFHTATFSFKNRFQMKTISIHTGVFTLFTKVFPSTVKLRWLLISFCTNIQQSHCVTCNLGAHGSATATEKSSKGEWRRIYHHWAATKHCTGFGIRDTNHGIRLILIERKSVVSPFSTLCCCIGWPVRQWRVLSSKPEKATWWVGTNNGALSVCFFTHPHCNTKAYIALNRVFKCLHFLGLKGKNWH